MKRIGLILTLILSTMVMSAQRGDSSQRSDDRKGGQKMSAEDRQKKELEQLTETLALTPEQVTDITALQDTLSVTMEEKRSTMSKDTDRKAMSEGMKELREKYNEDVLALLTEEQKVKYEAYLEKRESQGKQRQGSRPSGGQRGENND